jgi:hypothetical protein
MLPDTSELKPSDLMGSTFDVGPTGLEATLADEFEGAAVKLVMAVRLRDIFAKAAGLRCPGRDHDATCSSTGQKAFLGTTAKLLWAEKATSVPVGRAPQKQFFSRWLPQAY